MAGLSLAYADRSNRVRVELSNPAELLGLGAAGQAGNWAVTDGDSDPVQIAKIEQGESRSIWLLTVHPAFLDGESYAVAAGSGLLTSGGDPYDDPASASFVGLGATTKASASLRRRGGLDFALPTLGDPGRSTIGRTYQTTAAGDYALTSGIAARESDYLRRLLTRKGGFAFIPAYGVGFVPKQVASGATLTRLQREVAEQMGREPGVAQVAPRVEAIGSGVVVCSIRVRTVDGGELTAAAKLGGQ